MSPLMKELGIDRLTAAQRLELVQEIWDSIATDPSTISITRDQKKELGRRFKAFNANPNQGSSWDEIRRRIEKRARK